MKALLTTIFAVCVSFAANAQTQDTIAKDTKQISVDSLSKKTKFTDIATNVDQLPRFPGGEEGFKKYLIANLRYPQESFKNKIQGRVVLTIIVEKDGTVSNVKVVKHVAEDIDREAARVLINSPKWSPGMLNNKPVRVQYALPINFTL